MERMRLIDTHLHVWDPEVFDYAWLDEVPELKRRRGFEELSADFAPDEGDEVRYVFVQADCAAEQSLPEVDWVSAMAEANGVAGIVAAAPLEVGADVEETLAALRDRPLVIGVRRLLQSEPQGFALQDAFLAGARTLARTGLTFDACVVEALIPDVTALADAAPDLTIVLDHLGKPDVAGGDFDSWRRAIGDLAARPNVNCKISGLPSLTTADWTPDDLTPYLDVAVASFGADRCMFGSDWPASSLQSSYTRWLQFVRAWSGTLSTAEAESVLWRTAERVYGV